MYLAKFLLLGPPPTEKYPPRLAAATRRAEAPRVQHGRRGSGILLGASWIVAAALLLPGTGYSASYFEDFRLWRNTQAGIWQTIDLGAFGVPANAVVQVAMLNKADDLAREAGLRQVQADPGLQRRIDIQAADSVGDAFVVLHAQANASSQVQSYSENINDVEFALLGYWDGGTYVEKLQVINIPMPGENSWLDCNLGAMGQCGGNFGVGANQIAEIIVFHDNPGFDDLGGVRADGSTLQRRFLLDPPNLAAGDPGETHVTLLVQAGPTAAATIELFSEDVSDVSFYLAGHWTTPPAEYVERFVQMGKPSVASWSTLTMPFAPGNTTGEIVLENFDPTDSQSALLGTRPTGSSLPRIHDIHQTGLLGTSGQFASQLVNIDANQQIEYHFGSDLTVDARYVLVGLWAPDLTAATIAEFEATPNPDGSAVRWTTTSEVGTLGFRLWRFDRSSGQWVAIHDRMVPAVPGAAQGAAYELIHEGVLPGEGATYALEEIDTLRGSRFHGPFEATLRERGESRRTGPRPALGKATVRSARSKSAARPAGPHPDTQPYVGPTSRRPLPPEGLRVGVTATGPTVIPAPDLAAVWGVPVGRMRGWIRSDRLRCERQGRAIDCWARGDGVAFYGQATDSVYTREAAYRLWVDQKPGRLGADSSPLSHNPGLGQAVGGTFVDRVRFEEDRFAATVVPIDPDDGIWYWGVLVADDPVLGRSTHDFELLDPVAGRQSAKLSLRVVGATDTPARPEHHLVVRVNGSEAGETRFDGLGEHQAVLEVDPALLVPGANTLEVESVLDTGAPYSVVYVDRFEVSYERRLRAVDNRLALTASEGGALTVDGFLDSRIEVWDVSWPEQPRRLPATVTDSDLGFQVIFQARAGGRYETVAENAWLGVSSLRAWRASEALGRAGADYLVVAPEALRDAAEALGAYRRDAGLATRVVSLEAAQDAFYSGDAHPESVHRLLRHAWEEWDWPPRYAVLVGAGTFDYLDRQGFDENRLPPRLLASPHGLFASDVSLGEVAGDGGAPEIAVGRLPFVDGSELTAYLDKLKAWEHGSLGNVLLLADDPDSGGNFPDDSDRLLDRLPPGLPVERIYLSEYSVAEARKRLFSSAEAGVNIVNWLGHGGLDRLASEGLLLAADSPEFASGWRQPIVVSATCVIGRFEIPGFESLGEALVRVPAAGAVAVFAPAGLSVHLPARELDAAFVEALTDPGTRRLGDALLAARRAYAESGSTPYLAHFYNLLGDPALPIR